VIFFRDENKARRQNRHAFRPVLGDSSLEERVVMNATAAHISAAANTANAGMTAAQVRAAFNTALQNATRTIRNFVNAQSAQLFANGTPTTDQINNFRAQVAGAVNATALSLSSQAALLPRSDNTVASIQNALLGSGRNSLLSRIDTALQNNRNLSSATRLQNAIGNGITNTFLGTRSTFNNFFNTTPLNRLSVDASGNQIPLQQFLGGRVISQFQNSLGAFANAFPNVANSALFPNGVNNGTSPSSDLLQAFNSQTSNALGTLTAQLGRNLQLFPNSGLLSSQLNPLLFGSGTGTGGTGANAGFLNSLQNLQFGGANFNSDVSNLFNTGFSNIVSPLNSFFGLQGQQNATLPMTGFNNIFGQNFASSTFNNGFNNGFATTGVGFPGFGTAPTGFNNAFGTGFNNFNTSVNSGLGFNFPTLGGTLGTGGLGGAGIGTSSGGLGAGAGGSGLGSGAGLGLGI